LKVVREGHVASDRAIGDEASKKKEEISKNF